MQVAFRQGWRLGSQRGLLALAAAAGLGSLFVVCGPASAQPAPGTAARPGYFVEFRARPSADDVVGHTFVIYGWFDAKGRRVDVNRAGLIPGDLYKLAINPFIPRLVPAKVRADPDDIRIAPEAIFLRRVTAAEYRRVVAKVRELRGTMRQWHLFLYNCNVFANEIADSLKLGHLTSVMPPRQWVEALHLLNPEWAAPAAERPAR